MLIVSEKSRQEIEEFEQEIPLEPQSVYEAEIYKIYRGKLKDLIDIEAIRNPQVKERYEQQKDRDALEIWFKVKEDNTEKYYKEVVLISRHPNSKLVKILRTYGKIKVGMKIQVYTTKWGYPRIKTKG